MHSTWTRLIPWVITAAIFAIIFWRIPVADVVEALRQVRPLPYLALMAPYSLFYCLVDTFVLSRAVRWFHRRVAYGRLLPIRASSYILSLLNPGLGQGGLAFYVHRREDIAFLALAGTLLFLAVMEFCQLALYASLGIVVLHADLVGAFAPLYAGFAAVVVLVLLLLHKGIDPLDKLLARFGRHRQWRPTVLLETLRQARFRHCVRILLYKAPNFVLAVVVHYFALQLFGVQVPFTRLFVQLPIVFLVASLPITVAHLGTSQAAWLYFFSAYGDESQILAYSLVAHVTFMVLNSLIGLAFLPLALRGLRDVPVAAGERDVPSPMPTPDMPEP